MSELSWKSPLFIAYCKKFFELFKLTYSNFLTEEKIPLIFSIEPKLKFDKSREIKDEQSLNILSIYLTVLISKFDKFKNVNEEHL